MSKVVINYDTTEKTMSVKMGSTVLEDVAGVYVYRKWDEEGKFSVEISQVSKNEKDDVVTIIRTLASEDGEVWTETQKEEASEAESCPTENLSELLFPRRYTQ